MMGKVYLVGAGPGDPGLLTMRGHDLISRADVILYDSLSSPELLETAQASCEKIFVGKRAGQHHVIQKRINELLVQYAQQGKTVVRLKGGDPYLYGRGGEEALVCREAGISFEVVPGITSALAVPAYAGIPVLQRGVAGTVMILHGRLRDHHSALSAKVVAEGERLSPESMVTEEAPVEEMVISGGKYSPDSQPTLEVDMSEFLGESEKKKEEDAPAPPPQTEGLQEPDKPEKRGGIKISRRKREKVEKESSESFRLRMEAEKISPTASRYTATATPSGERDVPLDLDWSAVCRAADTLIFLMFLGTMDEIRAGLLRGGRDPQEPVAAIQWGTTARQRTVVSTIDAFPNVIRSENLAAPAVLVIGEVVNLREKLSFYENRSMFGWKVAVTEPDSTRGDISTRLADEGASALSVPALLAPPLAESPKELLALAEDFHKATHLIISREDLVESFQNSMRRSGFDVWDLYRRVRVLAVGDKTAQLLAQEEVLAITAEPPVRSSAFKDAYDLSFKKSHAIVIEAADEWGDLADDLEEAGAHVTNLPVRPSLPNEEALGKLRDAIEHDEMNAVAFQSVGAAKALGEFWGPKLTKQLLGRVIVAAQTDEIANVLVHYHVTVHACAKNASPEALVKALVEYRSLPGQK